MADLSNVKEALFVGNASKSYVALSNFRTEIARNNSVEYVTTLRSKYPYAVRNGEVNYTTGVSKGLFLRLAPNGRNFLPDYDHSFATEIINFLSDGTPKIVKMLNGQEWYVSIDGNPREIYSEFLGAHEIEFSWTEIGAVPTNMKLAEVTL